MYINAITNAFKKLLTLGGIMALLFLGIILWLAWGQYQDYQARKETERQAELQQAFALGKAALLLQASHDFNQDGELNFAPVVTNSEGEPVMEKDQWLRAQEYILVKKDNATSTE